jgi:hypothetical protein
VTYVTSYSKRRVWLCVRAPGHLTACATHLVNSNPRVALAQCRYLLRTAIPAMRRRHALAATVVGGDFNLTEHGQASVHACVPSGYRRWSDGSAQHVLATGGFGAGPEDVIDMRGATDHPSLTAAPMPPGSTGQVRVWLVTSSTDIAGPRRKAAS